MASYVDNPDFRLEDASYTQPEGSAAPRTAGPRLSMACLPNVFMEAQTVTDTEGPIGYQYDDKRWRRRTTQNNFEPPVGSPVTGSADEQIITEYSLDRDALNQAIPLRTTWTFSGAFSRAAEPRSISCPIGSPAGSGIVNGQRTWQFDPVFHTYEFRGFILATPSNRYFWEIETSFNCDGPFTLEDTYLPPASQTVAYSEEITQSDQVARRQTSFDAAAAIWANVDGPLTLSLDGWVTPRFNEYEVSDHEGPSGAGRGEQGTIAEIANLAASREARADGSAVAGSSLDDLNDDLDAKDQEIADRQSDLSTAQADLAAAESQYTADKAAYEAAEANLQSLAAEWSRHRLRLSADTSDLSQAELNALIAARDAAEAAYNTAKGAMPTLPGTSDLDLARDEVFTLHREIELLQAQRSGILAARDAAQELRQAILDNEGYPSFDTFNTNNLGSGSSASTVLAETDADGIPQTTGRYRVAVNLSRDYDFSGGPRTITVEWREQLEVPGTPNPTYSYTARSADITVSSPGIHHTAWQDVAAPAQPGAKITICPLAQDVPVVPSTVALESGARKRGIYGYTLSTPPKVYRKEAFSGSFPGCPALGLPAKTYGGTREATDEFGDAVDPPTDDVVEALQGRWQPSVGSVNDRWSAHMPRPPVVEQSATSRTYLQRMIDCDGTELTDELTGTLSGEVTTDEIIQLVNDYLQALINYEDDFQDYSENGGTFPTFPSPPEFFASGPFLGGEKVPWADAVDYGYRLQDADELGYYRRRTQFSFVESDGPGSSVDVHYTLGTINLLTGVITTSEQTVTVQTDAQGDVTPQVVLLDPPLGELHWIANTHRDESGAQAGQPKITSIA